MLQTAVSPRALSRKERLRLLELEEMELMLERERRRRGNENIEQKASIITLEERHKAFIAAYPFKDFVFEAFKVVEPGRKFRDNWHIDIIAELLQAVILGDVRNFIINQPRRTMKPVEEGALVLMGDGQLKPLRSVNTGEYVITHEGRAKKVSAVHIQGELDCLEITTFSGRKIITALDHPFLTPQGWIQAKDLQLNQSLALIPKPVLLTESNNRRKDSEFVLAGYIVGDGSTARNGQTNMFAATITSQNPTYVQEVNNACNDLGFTANCKLRSNNVYQINLSNGVRDWLREIGLAYKTSYTKTVPEFVFQGSNEQIAQFISAYFNCDGCVSKSKPNQRHIVISFTSVSERLLLDVQHLLLRLGIKAKIRRRERKLDKWMNGKDYVYYMLEVTTNDDCARFFNTIPISSYKRAKLADHNAIEQEFLPKYFGDKITSIEFVGKQKCRCLTVEDDSSFTANDYVVHNSLLTCVFFPCWVWTFLPHLRFLFTSYSKDFAKRDNKKCQDLINSDYYRNKFGHIFCLTMERAEKLMNNRGGFRVVFRIGKGVGEGGDFVIADDPNDVEETESEQQLDKTNKGWGEISSQNVTDRTTAVRGINQQRTAPNDVTGYILENEKLKSRYAVLCLPNRFEDDHPDTNTPERPLYLGKVSDYDKAKNPNLFVGEDKFWIDPRCKDAPYFGGTWYQEWYKKYFASRGLESKGEPQLLWEDYIGEEETADAEAHLGAYGTSAQMQQRPIRRGGNFFNTENFRVIHISSLALNGLKFCRYWDKAGSEGKGDWTVGLLLARTIKRPFRFWVIDVIRKQVGYYERMELIKSTAKQDTLDYIDKFFENEYSVVIEREPASSGKDVATIEKDELVGYDTHIDTVRKNKAIRAKPVRTFSESGRIQVVQGLWNEAFFKEIEKFDANKPNQKNDQVDGLSGAFRFLAFGVSNRGSSESGSY